MNEFLKQAFQQAAEEEIAAFPQAEPHVFSADFERKMERLIRDQKKPVWKYVNTAGKRIAMVVAVLAVLFAGSMTVEAVRVPVVEYVRNVYDICTEFIFHRAKGEEDAPTSIETVFSLSEIPQDFEMTYDYQDLFRVQRIWKNQDDEYISFSQAVLETQYGLDTEGVGSYEVWVNGQRGFFVEQDDCNLLIWSSKDYTFMLDCSKDFDQTGLIRMAESLTQDLNGNNSDFLAVK